MKSIRLLVGVCIVGLLLVTAARSQEPPKPGPEHAKLKDLVGAWDATMKMGDMESKATAVYRMGPGSLWLLSNFSGEFAGTKFSGHGVDGYDTAKKKYVSMWVDSMTTTPMLMEGTYDSAGKVLTMTGEMPGPDGKLAKARSTSEMSDKDTMIFKMHMGDSKDPMFVITYKRKPQEEKK